MIHHRGPYFQRGRGFGGIFSSIIRFLKPIFTKGLVAGRKALNDPTIKSALSSIKDSTVKAGTRAYKQQMGKIAPEKKAKKPMKNAQKRLQTAFISNKVKKKRSNVVKDKSIFD